jgi:6-phosphogluconate dehydrogenase
MQIGVIGLGRMGGNIVRRLLRGGHQCVVYDRQSEPARLLAAEGAVAATDLKDLVARLTKPRAVWVMLPAGEITDRTVTELAALMERGDTIIDGGNSFYKDDIRRAAGLRDKDIRYVDVGTSGGIWGFERGYCMMIGGDKETVDRLDPIFATLAPGPSGIAPTPGRKERDTRAERGYLHCGPNGAGHFVKMIHNGIEYGLMQAYAEGFDILKNAASEALPAEQRYALDLADIARVWRRGGSSVPASRPDGDGLGRGSATGALSGVVQIPGEGRWTILAASRGRARSVGRALRALRSREEHSSPRSCCRRCATSSAAMSSPGSKS